MLDFPLDGHKLPNPMLVEMPAAGNVQRERRV